MTCICLKKVEAKLATLMVSQAGPNCTAEAANMAFWMPADDINGQVGYSLQIPYIVKGSKKGYTSEKGKRIGVNASSCPFCGKRFGQGEGDDDGIANAFGKEAQ